MKIGIPRALLYYKNEKFWTTFFDTLGIEYIVGPETTKEIISRGTHLSVDETCLPTKILLGQVDWLIGKCDYVFLPRVEFSHGYGMCTKFLAQTDLVANVFRGRDIKLLFYNIGNKKLLTERKAVLNMGKYLGLKSANVKYAYNVAKQAQQYFEVFRTETQEKTLRETDKIKVLVVAHAYNIGDAYIGRPILRSLAELGAEPIIAEYADAGLCIRASKEVTRTMPWAYNRHLIGAIQLMKDKVDGVVLLTTFPCGPDSMVNELIVREYARLPIIILTIDSQDATAGMETRLESFIDIINFKREGAQ